MCGALSIRRDGVFYTLLLTYFLSCSDKIVGFAYYCYMFLHFGKRFVEYSGSVILATYVAENYFDYFNEFDWAGLFKHSAKRSIAQERRLAASPYR